MCDVIFDFTKIYEIYSDARHDRLHTITMTTGAIHHFVRLHLAETDPNGRSDSTNSTSEYIKKKLGFDNS